MTEDLDVNTNPRIEIGFTQIDARFEHVRVPLTRHMFYAWHRFDMRHRFHVQSDKNRLQFIVWYFWDYLPGNAILVSEIPEEIKAPLLEPVECWGAIPTFFFELWKSRYQNAPQYNLFTEDGYFRFLSEVAYLDGRTRCLPACLTDGQVLQAVCAPQPGYGGSYFLTRFLYQRWLSSKLYREKYTDLRDLYVLQSFIFDQIVHSLASDGEAVYPPDLLRWWAAPVHPELPRLSRFLRQLARHSKRFGERTNAGWVDSQLYQEILEWFDTTVLREWPVFASLVDYSEVSERSDPGVGKLSRGAEKHRLRQQIGRPLLPTVSEEIDVLVIGPYSAASGLGSGVRRSVGALEKLGCNYRVADFLFDSPSQQQGKSSTPRQYKGEKARINLWHYNSEVLFDIVASLPDIMTGRHNIGYFFWETEVLPYCLELGRDVVDEIWVPSEFCASMFSEAKSPVINVGTSVELPNVGPYYGRDHFGLDKNEFVFMFSFDAHSVMHRKNPAAVVRAFLKAFGQGNEPVRLFLKSQNFQNAAHWSNILGRGEELTELCSYDRRITFYNRTMTLRELYSLKNCSDCYVSLHRSEGFGYGPAEAMALGKPVIMSDYSANTEFGNETNAMMVPCQLVPIQPGEYLYWTPGMVWGEADIDIAAHHMRRVYSDRQFRDQLGSAAKKSITRDFGVEAMADRYRTRLEELGVRCAPSVSVAKGAA